VIQVSTETRYYISSLNSSVQELAQRIEVTGERQSPLCSGCDSRRGQESNSHDTFGTNVCLSAEFCLELVSREGLRTWLKRIGYVLWFGETQGSI